MKGIKNCCRTPILITTGLILFVILNSCAKDPGDCFKSTGEIITITRNLENFNAVLLYNNIDIEFRKVNAAEEIKIEITAGKNIIEKISSTIEDHEQYFQGIIQTDPETGDTINNQPGVNETYKRLVIANENQCNEIRNYTTPIKAIIYFQEIKNIETRSNGTIQFIDPTITDRFMINIFEGASSISLKLFANKSYLNFHYGTADLTVTGGSEINYIYQASFGPIDARDFATDFTYMENRSPNHSYVDARLQLGVTINGTGNVYYKTAPESINLNGTGAGQLLQIEP